MTTKAGSSRDDQVHPAAAAGLLVAATALVAWLAPPFPAVVAAVAVWLLLRCLRGWDIGRRAEVDLLPAGLVLIAALPGPGIGFPPAVVLFVTGAVIVLGLSLNHRDQRRWGRPRWYADDLRLVATAFLFWLLACGVNLYLLLLLPLAVVRRPWPPYAIAASIASGLAGPDPPSSRQRRMLLGEPAHLPLITHPRQGIRVAFLFPGWLLLWVAAAPLRRRETEARAAADAAGALLALGYLAPERRAQEARALLLTPRGDNLSGFECDALAAEAAYRLGRWDEVVARTARAETISANWPLAAAGHDLLRHVRLLAAIALAWQTRILDAERLLLDGIEPTSSDQRFLTDIATTVIELSRDGQAAPGRLGADALELSGARPHLDPILRWWLDERIVLRAQVALTAGSPRVTLSQLGAPEALAVPRAVAALVAATAAETVEQREQADAYLRLAARLTEHDPESPYGALARRRLDAVEASPTAPATPSDS